MKTEKINIFGTDIFLTRKKIKNLHIRISSVDASVSVSAPLFVSEEKITEFIESKREWIEKNTASVKKSFSCRCGYKNGDTVYLSGKPYILRVVSETKEGVTENDGVITVSVKENKPERVKKVFDVFCGTNLAERAKPIIKDAELLTGLKHGGLRIRDMKTRWGSCNIKTGVICLNLQLARRDDRLLRYIVIHEILHIRYPDHQKGFKSAMDKYCPDWRELKRKLNKGEVF